MAATRTIEVEIGISTGWIHSHNGGDFSAFDTAEPRREGR